MDDFGIVHLVGRDVDSRT